MDLAEHFGTIWRRRWRILIATLVVTGAVFAWRETRPKVYAASSLLSVTPARTSNSTLGSKDDVQFLAETYGALAQTRPVVAAAVADSKLALSTTEGMSRVSVD